MGWSTVAGAAVGLAALVSLIYAVTKLLKFGISYGEQKERLRQEVAARETREKIDEITTKAEEEYDNTLDNTDDLSFDDRRRLLFDSDDNTVSEASTDTPA